MTNKLIYTITTIRHALHATHRAVGFYHDFNDAHEAVENNSLDINEAGYYPYAVIEVLLEGIYSYPRSEYWYKYNKEKDKYETCEKPEKFKQVCGWSLG